MSKQPIMYYAFKQSTRDPTVIHISKLDRDYGPTDTYTIIDNPQTGELTCTCPSRFIPCKHVKLLRYARKAYANDWTQRYWTMTSYAQEVKSFTAEQLGLNFDT